MGVRSPDLPQVTSATEVIVHGEVAGALRTARMSFPAFVAAAVGDIFAGIAAAIDAKLDNTVSATNRFLGRISPGGGPVEELTPAQAASMLPAFTGDVGAGGAKGLVPAPAIGDAAANKFLHADGTFKPVVALGATLIASGALQGSAVTDIVNIPQTFAHLVLHITSMSCDTTNRAPRIQASVNNGASFDTTAANYVNSIDANGGGVAAASLAGSAVTPPLTATLWNIAVVIRGYQAGLYKIATAISYETSGISVDDRTVVWKNTGGLNALRIGWSGAGNAESGAYALYGFN